MFAARESLPAPEEERKRYLLHENDPGAPGYRAFLMSFVNRLAPLLAPGAEGLDYGSGPVPALVGLLAEAGFRVTGYDPFFQPDAGALARKYDFITCVETAEHFHRPGEEFARLASLMRAGARLGVKTLRLDDWREFARWHYHRDPTHVAFYSEKTMRHLAARFGWECAVMGKDMVVFTARAPTSSTACSP